MEVRWVIFSSVLFLNTAAALMLAVQVGRRRSAPGSGYAALMFVALAIWSFTYAIITLSNNLETKIFWLRLENLGILTVPVFWLLFSILYTRNEDWLNRVTYAMIWVVPIVSLTFIFSDLWMSLYYPSVTPFDVSGGPLIVTRGPWYTVQLIFSYGFLALGLLIFIWHMLRLRGLYRNQILIFLAGIVVPVLVNLFYQAGSSLFSEIYIPIDLTAISFTITAGLISVGVFGLRMFDLIPIARTVVIENIPEMVIVVDAYNRVLDANRVALHWLQKPMKDIIGRDLMKVFSLWPGLAGRFQSMGDVQDEIEVSTDPPRTLELLISPLRNRYGALEGRVILARDITDRKKMETDLVKANQALEARINDVDALRARLQEQTIRDPLTGLYNRRHLSTVLDTEMTRAKHHTGTFSIAAIDLDYFKRFNDAYGHKCGDHVLITFARLLNSKAQRGEIVCRYGGEEFVILMPDVPLDVALERAEDWRQSLEKTTFEFDGQSLFPATMSVGVATFPLHGKDGDAILQAADYALYRSKSGGRNRVTVYDERGYGDTNFAGI